MQGIPKNVTEQITRIAAKLSARNDSNVIAKIFEHINEEIDGADNKQATLIALSYLCLKAALGERAPTQPEFYSIF